MGQEFQARAILFDSGAGRIVSDLGEVALRSAGYAYALQANSQAHGGHQNEWAQE